MVEAQVKIINPLGLHARAAAQLVRLAGRFDCEIKLNRPDNKLCADAKSILSVLTLAAAQGTNLGVAADGCDEREALILIERLFADGFGEI